jgi:CTP-dependent riboflavin kinase
MLVNYRVFALSALTLALLAASVPELAAREVKEKKAAKAVTHDGEVVSITFNKLVMKSKGGKEHSHTLTADAKITCDGKVCKGEDLKAGTKIRVTTKTSDAKIATCIEAIDKNESLANSHDGTVISIKGNKLVMTGTQSKKEHIHTLTADVKVTCDGRVCKSSDLKPGMRIRVTSEDDDPHTAIRVEALDKKLKFASL